MRSKAQMIEARKLMKKPEGAFHEVNLSEIPHPDWMTRCFRNNRYMVMIDDNAKMSDGGTAIKAMIQRHDDAIFPNHWAELQRIKAQLFGSNTTAVEYFPTEKALSDKANIYWLYIYDGIPTPVK